MTLRTGGMAWIRADAIGHPAEYRLDGHGWKRMDGWVGRFVLFTAGLGIAGMATNAECLMAAFSGLKVIWAGICWSAERGGMRQEEKKYC